MYESSFWMPVILNLAKPKYPRDYILMITHSLLMDRGFIPLTYDSELKSNSEDKKSDQSIPKLKLPIIKSGDSFSLDLIPRNWKCELDKIEMFYTKRNSPPKEYEADYITEASIKVTFKSLEDSFMSIIEDYGEVIHSITIHFPKEKIDRFTNNESLKMYLSCEIEKWLGNKIIEDSEIKYRNTYIPLEGDCSRKSDSYDRNIETPSFAEDNVERRVYSPDPLFDDKGIRGSLVGPNSAVFKGLHVRAKPKLIPVSSIPGMRVIPDNDIYFPPGTGDFKSFY